MSTPSCGGSDYNGTSEGARISSIFVILVTSMFGAVFPVFARRNPGVYMPEWAFFGAKYFGSGVIIATAFIHLLAPASDSLQNVCLPNSVRNYDWAEGIALIMIFIMFFVELMTMRFANFAPQDDLEDSASPDATDPRRRSSLPTNALTAANYRRSVASTGGGDDHYGHQRDHKDNELVTQVADESDPEKRISAENYAAQLTGIFILEFGIIFHSVFVGLTLAVAGTEFKILYVVLVFHQTFEGLGLGSRLATVPWPKSKKWTPYIMGVAYGFTTPVAIAIGLGIRTTYNENSATALIVNGVFDAFSAGILIYTGLVELMAHEFMFSPQMKAAPFRIVFLALLLMVTGAGLMALLGKWA